MKIVIGTFAFFLVKPLIEMVASAAEGTDEVEFYIAVHSDRPEILAACTALAQVFNVRLFDYRYNRGLARSLNDMWLAALDSGADVYINCNDDVEWGPGDAVKLGEAAMQRRDAWMVSAMGYHAGNGVLDSMGWCAAALNPIAMEQIGCLDENFYPAYFEDVDYTRRARLAGLPEALAHDTCCKHAGSLTIMSDQTIRIANDLYFRGNDAYYQRKWGAGYTSPFNLGGSLRIAPEDRRAPYGELDRSDLAHEPLSEARSD